MLEFFLPRLNIFNWKRSATVQSISERYAESRGNTRCRWSPQQANIVRDLLVYTKQLEAENEKLREFTETNQELQA